MNPRSFQPELCAPARSWGPPCTLLVRANARPRTHWSRYGLRTSSMDIDAVSGHVVDAAIHLHRLYGPGLLESAYEWLMEVELRFRGLRVTRQVPSALEHRGERLSGAYRIDMLVED